MMRHTQDHQAQLPLADVRFAVESTRDAWRCLRGGRLFLTGGTGFIGTWFLEAFLYANRELQLAASVEVLSRDPEALLTRREHLRSEPALSFVAGDVQRYRGWNEAGARRLQKSKTCAGAIHQFWCRLRQAAIKRVARSRRS